MALKIIKAEEPIKVNQLVVVIYGPPGIGKTTLSFSSDASVLLDFDKGVYRAMNRKDSVPVTSWQDVTNITPEDLAPYKTVIVDTAGRALDFLTVNIIRNDPKKGTGGTLTLQGYGVLKSQFASWLTSLKLIGKDVVLIAHSSEEKNGDDMLERLDVQGGSKGEIYKSADAMGRIRLVNGQRILSFSPSDTAFGKNPGCLDALTIPDPNIEPDFLAGVIQQIKDKLNALTVEQQKRQKAIADWMAKIDEAKTADDFTQLAGESKGVDSGISAIVKGQINKEAIKAGFEFNKSLMAYTEAAA